MRNDVEVTSLATVEVTRGNMKKLDERNPEDTIVNLGFTRISRRIVSYFSENISSSTPVFPGKFPGKYWNFSFSGG